MESALSDEFLLLQARHGDHLAFSQLVAKYKLSIISFAARILGDPIEAEDVAQAVFIKVFIASQGFRFAAKFRTWLMAIARNLCLNELRRRMRHNADPARRYGELYEWVRCQDRNEACRTPSELISEQEFHSKIEAAIGELPDQQRTAILLLKEYEMAYEEIASVLKLTPSATKSLVHRARQALKNKLRPYLSGEARWASRVAGRNRARK
jgi:RNA polymerase sigma-70 factor (ECF subfamily)